MSVRRTEVSSVRFEINARPASVSMEALQAKADDLNKDIDIVKKNIADLGNVSPEHEGLKSYQKQLDDLNKKLKDVQTTMKDYTRGVKAADELLKAYDAGNIESLSMKAIKAGQNGLKKRIENIKPETANEEELKSYRIITEVIRESQRVVDTFKTDARETIQILEQGGTVAETTLKKTRDGVRDLMQTTKEGSKEYRDYQKQFEFLAEKMKAMETESARVSGQKMLGRAFRGDFATADTKTLNEVIAKLREYQSVIDDPNGKGARIFAAAEKQIQALSEQLAKTKGDIVSVEQAMEVVGQAGASVEKMDQSLKVLEDAKRKATDPTLIEKYDGAIDTLNQKIKESTGEWMSLADAEKLAEQAGENYYLADNKKGFIASPEEIQKATAAISRQRDALIKTIQTKKANGEATAAEERKLDDLTKKLRDLKFEQDNVNMSQEKMRTLMEKPAQAVSLDELRAAIKRADGELRRMEGSLGKNSKEYKAFAEQVKVAKNTLKDMEGAAKASASAWEKAVSRLKTYVGLYMGFNIFWQKMTGAASDLLDLSDRMGEVRKTTGFTADEVDRLSENLKKMDVRTPLQELMSISASAGQLGLKPLEDVQGFTEAANKLMIALPEMGREAATEMMRVAIATGEVEKIRKQLQEGTIEGSSATAVAMEKIASTIDRLRASSASTAPEITDFVKRVGAVGAQSGITIDQVAALGSTVSSLGMRVEMSATALSRMIPAIKNNAFELAKAIQVPPETIRELFDAGRGMEVILMILQRIKDSNMDSESIESMMGMAGMRDIMKDLNQQGARAGIVFAGLSQNVDELRRQLGVANQAYEENIAIQQEFDKMNETTAARWERLKNQIEELFVGNRPNRLLGGLIDSVRVLIDFLTGDNGVSAALRTILIYLGLVRLQIISIAKGALVAMGGGLRNIGIMLGFIKGEMTKLQWGNIFTALAGAVLYAYMAFKDLKSAAEKAADALGKAKDEVYRAQEQFNGYWKKLKDTSTALQEARKSHDQLSAEVDKLRNSTDKGAAATENMKRKEDELKKSEDKVTQASDAHRTAISQMNSIYGKYLGFILTETNYANLAAAAHDKVAAAIEREMLAKQKQAAISEVDSNYSAEIASNYGKMSERLTQQGLNRSQASQAMADLQKFLRENVSYDAVNNQTVVSKAVTDQLKKSGLNLSKATSNEIVALWYDKYLKDTYHLSDRARMNITGVNRTDQRDEGWQNAYSPFATNVRGGYADTYVQRERERGAVSAVYDVDLTRAAGEEAKAAGTLLTNLEKQAQEAKKRILDKKTSDKDRNDAYVNLANALEGLDNRINELDPKKDAETISRLRDMAKSLSAEGISVKKLTAARREIHSTLFDRATFDENAIREAGNANPWGGDHEASSTDWKNMTAEQLVNRRKQMKDFVNAIQTDTDVQSVLKEDAALKKAIEAGMSSDMRTVIEWYNTERLKIQDELHARHLTNTGDWLDPKKERGAKKQFRDEMDAYLHELDAYYTERKTRIEEAGTDEGLTEAEIRNRTLANEMEWRQRRAELQKLYSRKSAEVTREEQEAVFAIIAERTGDTERFVEQTIQKTNRFVDSIEKSGDKGAAIVHRWMSGVELETERDYLKQQQALTKQMKAIQDIIDRERPFNGITKQLRENLATMDILTGDMRKRYQELLKSGTDEEKKRFNEEQAREEVRRTAFMLGEAEQAYSTTIDRVMADMREKGMTAWADWLQIHPEQQEGLMAQLRSTYDQIQDAIKKEASQLKKQAEIMWNNILVPGGDGQTTLKQMMDRTVAQLGIDQGRVSRANSLIGAGVASDRVADRLAIKQMQLQLTMQEHYYNLMKKQGRAHVDMLNKQADAAERRGDAEEATRKRLDAQHAEMALNLATAKEETELAKQREEIIARTEESQNRLYTELKEWADLLSSSLQSVFEASHAGDAEYYNERAKLDLTGKGGPGAGTYVVIDDAGTSDATAHYEYLDERQALERQHEIEQQNAQAEAWKKLWDDINMKMSDQITDWLNASLQDAATRDNTDALNLDIDATKQNTEAVQGLTSQLAQGININTGDNGNAPADNGFGADKRAYLDSLSQSGQQGSKPVSFESTGDFATDKMMAQAAMSGIDPMTVVQSQIDADNLLTQTKLDNQKKISQGQKQSDNTIAQSTQATYSKMAAAMNMYGLAYQTMSNDNMDMTEKFLAFSLQAAGQVAIGMLTTDMYKTEAEGEVKLPGILGEAASQLGPIAGPIAFAAMTALLGGLMAMAMSKVTKAKSQISQVTGASVGAGRLATGMLTYAEGNVNEFTDPASLTPGRQYNVDGADGKTYRARYMGKDAKTHITNGPEFHLVGEKGREAIIDAHTTRLMQTDDTGIWQAIQTLYNGGRVSGFSTRRGRGVRAFAEGNINDFEEMGGGYDIATDSGGGMSMEQVASLQASLDRNSDVQEALLERLQHPLTVAGTGSNGVVAMYDKLKKEAQRQGVKYI